MSDDQQPTPPPLDLEAIEKRASAASPGPWGDYDDSDELVAAPNHIGLMEAWICRCTRGDWVTAEQKAANQQFIAHARQDVPALVAEVRRLRADLAAARAALEHYADAERWGNGMGRYGDLHVVYLGGARPGYAIARAALADRP